MRYGKPKYINWLIKNDGEFKLKTNESVNVYSINHEHDEEILDEWGKHISQHYISNDQAEQRASQLKIPKYDYMFKFWLDLAGKDISGNFAEIVFSDYLEYVLNFEVPRYKLFNNYPGNPQQGIDLVGFKFFNNDKTYSPNDAVNFMEVKAALSRTDYKTITNSIDDINKRTDVHYALILENAHEKLRSFGCFDEVALIERFQDSEKQCVKIKSSGALTISSANFENDFLGLSVTNGKNVTIHLIHGIDLLDLAKDLYRRACK